MMIKLLKTLLLSFILVTTVSAQDSTKTKCNYSSFGIPSGKFGLGFGNSSEFTGIRFNLSDCDIKEINGINITLWKPGNNYDGEVSGISLGIAPNAKSLVGFNFGIAGVVAHKDITGINFSGLGLVAEEDITGISISGLGLVAQNDLSGINIAGLGCVSQGSTTGLNFAGLGLVSEGSLTGINLGGLASVGNDVTGFNYGTLAVVSQGELTGINIGGMAVVAEGDMTGLNFSGLANVSQGRMKGINISGLALVGLDGITGFNFGGAAIVSEDSDLVGVNLTVGVIKTLETTRFLNIAGYKIEANNAVGLNTAAIWNDIDYMSGIAISGYNKINKEQNGISIGILNFAKVLNGIQIGLINIAKNNPVPFRVLPIINANL